jgi:hypothetical protein
MFGLNDNNNKPEDNPGGMPAESPATTPSNPFSDNAAGPPASPPPATGSDTPAPAPVAEPAAVPAGPPAGSDDLIALKGQALNSLQPLVGHLDQSPEEKFKTTMMLIQATDNQSLVKQAYEAANQIPDEKARAQALLDVVNEINYFTQKTEKN